MRVDLRLDDLVLTGPGLEVGAGLRFGLPLGRLAAVRTALHGALASEEFQAHLRRPIPSPRWEPITAKPQDGLLVVSIGERTGLHQLRYAPEVVIPYRHLTAVLTNVHGFMLKTGNSARAAVKHRNAAHSVPAPRRTANASPSATWRALTCSWRGCTNTVGDALSGVCSRHYGQNRHYIRVVSGGGVGSNRRH